HPPRSTLFPYTTLFRSFTDVTKQAGLLSWGPSYCASWVDYDCDGRLDLFVNYNLGGMLDRRSKNRLFHNNGDGTFTDVTKESGRSEEHTSELQSPYDLV